MYSAVSSCADHNSDHNIRKEWYMLGWLAMGKNAIAMDVRETKEPEIII